MQLINSKIITVPHGFSTRDGGISTGPFSSLNTSYSVGDRAEAVDENLRRLAVAAKAAELLTISQVHGLNIVQDLPSAEADAIWTRRAHVAVGVRTADCLPILIEDLEGRRVAAVHAGWRGVIGQLAPSVVRLFAQSGATASSLRVAVGPAIGRCCFEVDGDLPQRFREIFGADVVVGGYPKPHLDLGLAVRNALEAEGVLPINIEVLPHCTKCDERFFSHRRDSGVTGRHLSFITCAFGTDL